MAFPNSSQVLGSVKNRIEVFAASHEDFPVMLKKAQQYLVGRGKVDRSDGAVGVAPLRRADSLGKGVCVFVHVHVRLVCFFIL